MPRKDDGFSDPVLIEFGHRIRALRVARHWTQRDLAEEAGIGERFVAYLERGRAAPTLTTILRLARTLDVSPGSLVDGLSAITE